MGRRTGFGAFSGVSSCARGRKRRAEPNGGYACEGAAAILSDLTTL